MIVDTSAIVAILLSESEAPAFKRLIAEAAVARVSTATLVELGVVIDTLRDPIAPGLLERFLADADLRIEPLTLAQALIAQEAHRRFGRTSGHPARLNMGDCFSYALARDFDEPLLFKGSDFVQTDIELVVDNGGGRRLSEVVASYGASPPA